MSSPRLPEELQDYIVDLLHNMEVTLRTCSLVSKSWLPRTRRHLFADIKFRDAHDLQSWKTVFPDPYASPAYLYTRVLSISCPLEVVAAHEEEGCWIRAFSHIAKLEIIEVWDNRSNPSLVPLYGVFPAIKSLSIFVANLTRLQVSGFIKTFPLLEDISVTLDTSWHTPEFDHTDELPNPLRPPAPPPFTGSLKLSGEQGVLTIVPQLFPPLGNLPFQGLGLTIHSEQDFLLATELVDRCSSTLEIIDIEHHAPRMSIYCADLRQELTMFVDASPSPTQWIDLSKATKLKEGEFVCHLDPKWIAGSLRTITHNHRDLKWIRIDIPHAFDRSGSGLNDLIRLTHAAGEGVYQRWLELDRILAQLQESHSIRLTVYYDPPTGMSRARVRGYMSNLLPVVMTRGIVELVQGIY